MLEEPKRQDTDAQGSAATSDGQGIVISELSTLEYFKLIVKYLPEPLIPILRFTLNHIAPVLSVLYIWVTAIGFLISWTLYRNFGVNIFDYSEAGDFFLAAFKNPGALLLVGELLFLYIFGILVMDNAAKILSGKVPSREARFEPVTTWIAFFSILLLIVASVVSPLRTSGADAASIKHGEKPTVDVRYRSFSGSAGQVTVPRLVFIGATQRANFFYDADNKRTLMIPQSQLVSIEVQEQD